MSKRRPTRNTAAERPPQEAWGSAVRRDWCCLALDLAPHAIVLWSPEGTILDCNAGALRMFGYEREGLVGRPVTQLAAEAAGAELLLSPDTDPAGAAARGAFDGIRQGGEVFPLEVERQLVDLPSGRAVLGLIHDITAQRQATTEMERRQALDETLAAISSSFISRSGDRLDESISEALSRMAAATGSDAARALVFTEDSGSIEAVYEWFTEGVLRSAKQIVGGRLDPSVELIARQLRREPTAIESVTSLPKGSRERRSLEALGVGSALAVPMVCAGRLVGLLAVEAAQEGRAWPAEEQRMLATAAQVLAGAVQRKRAQQELEASHRRMRQLAELLPDMVVEADAGLQVTYMNRAAQKALGYSSEEVQAGLPLSALVGEEALAELRGALEEMAGSGRGRIGRWDLQRKRGGSVKVESHSVPVTDPQGKVTGVITAARDISPRQRVEQTQRLASLGELAAGVAHEFNNLLSVMSAQAEVTQAHPSDTATKKLIRTVLDAAAQGGRITKSLEGFARPQEPRREPITIRAPLDAALAMAAHELRNGNVQLHREYGDEDRLILADAGQLQQVFLNLIINARHAMPQGGTLTVATGHDRGEAGQPRVTVRIADTGTGIAADALPRIFEPFFTTKRQPGSDGPAGTGLGLSVSHSIITAHGGTISVDSQPGAGTVFSIALDEHEAALAQPAARPTPRSRPTSVAGEGRRVLVAEDSALLSEAIRTLLDAAGFQVALAATTKDALAAMEGTPPDVVVTDLMMPGGGGGREVLRRAAELPGRPPVILMTGRTEEALTDELIAEGASRCLQKPFRLKDLLAEIDSVLEQRR